LWGRVSVDWACFPQIPSDPTRSVSGEFGGHMNTSDSLLCPVGPPQIG